MSWREVLAIHKTLRGIGSHSLLVDRGESGYHNEFLPDGRIIYPGEGLQGNQQPTGGNRVLLEAYADRRPMRVFAREAPNRWRDLGRYRIERVEYSWLPRERRYIYKFTLEPELSTDPGSKL
ncbi:MAG: hypothetical protein C4327_13465 [Meiothermus sp.]